MRLHAIVSVATFTMFGCAADDATAPTTNGAKDDISVKGDVPMPSDGELGVSTNRLCNDRSDKAWNVSISQGHYGSWGCTEYCPEGSYVQQILTRWDCQGGGADCSGVNVIQLSCHWNDANKTYTGTTVTSSKGWWGVWEGYFAPADWGFATGMHTFTMPKQGGSDDSSMTEAMLTNSSGAWGVSNHYSIDSFASGSCGGGQAVCGLRTRLEAKQGEREDDTALNGVEIACCWL